MYSLKDQQKFEIHKHMVKKITPQIVYLYAKKHKLSPKELEVIAIVVAGSKLGDVARTSNRSTKTLYSHKRNACFKIGVSSDVDFFCIIFIGLAKNYE